VKAQQLLLCRLLGRRAFQVQQQPDSSRGLWGLLHRTWSQQVPVRLSGLHLLPCNNYA